MSLKSRITIAVIGLLAVATVAMGWAVQHSLTSYLLNRLDHRLMVLAEVGGPLPGFPVPYEGDAHDEVEGNHQEESETRLPRPRHDDGDITLAMVWTGSSWSAASFQPAEHLTPPDIPPPSSVEFRKLQANPTTVGSTDQSVNYRVVASSGGPPRVVASLLSDVEATSTRLLGTLAVAGLVTVTLGGLVAWRIVSRALRPVDRMIDTAAAIAAGDLSQRVEANADSSELARLGGALDDMLIQLEADAREKEATQERLQRFVSDASHELRTPVAVISGYAELYRSGGVEPGEGMDRAFGRIESESLRMGSLVEDLLLLTKLDREAATRLEPIDLSVVVADVVEAFRVVVPDREVTLASDGAAVMHGDARRMRQVVDNLLRNAATHTPSGSPVFVSVRVTEAPVMFTGKPETHGKSRISDAIVLEVRDTGSGVPVNERERIFERFHRGDPSRARATGGYGLGLSIAKAIVESHDGRISVGDAPNGGAVFTVLLPVGD